MGAAVITGSAGLVGSEAAEYFGSLGLEIVGVDNDTRRALFGPAGSTAMNRARLEAALRTNYHHYAIDIRDRQQVMSLFSRLGSAVVLVVHTAAQPSHDWAARDPFLDFDINAVGTLNLLEATRRFAPDAVFIFTSTNKVYGDVPNSLPLRELETRWEIAEDHQFTNGITEEMRIDRTLHSLFGSSKAAADLLVQEYGRYFGMATACFRGGTLTGPRHSAVELHGFLAYMMRCAMTGTPYTIYGYRGKQVRDAIHSSDLVRAFHRFFLEPRVAEVYNIGGGRSSNVSVLEAIDLVQAVTERELECTYVDSNRIGDHIWWISSNARFCAHYPGWSVTRDVPKILHEILGENRERWVGRRRTSQAAHRPR